jgi:TonB family protein
VRKLLIVVVGLSFAAAPAFGADDVEAGLRAELVRKHVMLREPAVGKKLEFDREGKPVGERAPGSVATSSIYEVESVELKGGVLILRTRRVVLLNPEPESFVTSDKTEMRLELADASSIGAVRVALLRVFVDAQELEARKKNLWKPPSAEEKAQSIMGFLEGKPVLGLKVGQTKPPKAVSMRDPEYGGSGTVVLAVVIDERGIPAYIEVLRSPKELGGKAVEAVSLWRFEPAMRDGVPVATRVNVEVNFRVGL